MGVEDGFIGMGVFDASKEIDCIAVGMDKA